MVVFDTKQSNVMYDRNIHHLRVIFDSCVACLFWVSILMPELFLLFSIQHFFWMNEFERAITKHRASYFKSKVFSQWWWCCCCCCCALVLLKCVGADFYQNKFPFDVYLLACVVLPLNGFYLLISFIFFSHTNAHKYVVFPFHLRHSLFFWSFLVWTVSV